MAFPQPADEYKVSLEVFEGPMDLLLYLIRREEVDIYDIPIARIAEQYREHLNLMRMLDLSVAGEFIVMAATLELIKSRMLLPDDEVAEDPAADDEERDPRWDLVRQLVEYKRFKDAANRLRELEFERQNVFSPGGAPVLGIDPDEGKPFGDVGLADLLEAFRTALENAPVEPEGEIEPVLWTVPEKIDMILGTVRRSGGGVAFSRLFTARSPRGEIIVTFLALLELLRQHRIRVTQPEPFTEIVVSAGEEAQPAPATEDKIP